MERTSRGTTPPSSPTHRDKLPPGPRVGLLARHGMCHDTNGTALNVTTHAWKRTVVTVQTHNDDRFPHKEQRKPKTPQKKGSWTATHTTMMMRLRLFLLLLSITSTSARSRWFAKLRAGAADVRTLRKHTWFHTNQWPTPATTTTLSTSYGNDDDNSIVPASDLRRPGRRFHIVTTAALPWFTGTAVNPVLRAAYLHRRTQEYSSTRSSNATTTTDSLVALVIPWLEEPDDQERLYGRVFATPLEQESYIRGWLRSEAGMPDAADALQFRWYPARYHAGLGSIFAMGDILECCADDVLDVFILEEPENWCVLLAIIDGCQPEPNEWTCRLDTHTS